MVVAYIGSHLRDNGQARVEVFWLHRIVKRAGIPVPWLASIPVDSEQTIKMLALPEDILPDRLVVGREQQIEELRHRLQESGSVTYVSGLAGRGKTTLAL
jgi:hypothetical protein